VGGQGILSIATVIGYAAVEAGLQMKQAEVHGMSQRGGDVQSHLRISDREIFSDLVPFGGADLILSVEPMEALRYLPYLGPKGWVISNTTPFNNIQNYPDMEKVLEAYEAIERKLLIDADESAQKAGNAKGMNMVMAGAASVLLPLSYETMQQGIRAIFGRKGEAVVASNLAALEAGREMALSRGVKA
jgi:indolepyruvate ferredoxin oxidoreductase beta subunit